MGPVAHQDDDVYLRTAVSVGQEGWAHFDYVKMPDYRWGIFLADAEQDRTIGFGDRRGEPVWTAVPGELRSDLRRLIVVQGDTEPASVEQQRQLCLTAPSLYDLRNLFQVNVEEARHLWAMVYLLHAYFGRDGRDEADLLLTRHSGDADQPRILGAFNEPTTDWLSFFMFTYFTDRDGKFQLASLAESGFDPLARTCQFMLKEEAHHMFVGAGGVGRVVQRTAELMREHDTDDVTPYGGINLATVQRYLNLHYSVSLDLFGAETSTNAANYYAAGLKGRFQEAARPDDHRLHGHVPDHPRRRATTGSWSARWRPCRPSTPPSATTTSTTARRASTAGTGRWRRSARSCASPMSGSTAGSGPSRGRHVTPDGELVSEAEWEAHRAGLAAHRRRPRPGDVGDAPGPRARSHGQLDRAARQRRPRPARRLRVRPGLMATSVPGEAASTRPGGWSTATCRTARASRVAYRCGEETQTYAELQRATWMAANGLRALGVEAGDRVLMVVGDELAFPATFLGALRIGAVPVPVSTMLLAHDVAALVADSGARVVVASGRYAGLLAGGHGLDGRGAHRRRRPSRPRQSAPRRPPARRRRASLGGLPGRIRGRRRADDGVHRRPVAVHLGHHRPAQGRHAPPRRHPGRVRHLRPLRPRDRTGRRVLLGPQALLRLRARQRPVLPLERRAPAR